MSQGGPLFLTYALYNFLVNIILFMLLLFQGAQANQIEQKILDKLYHLQRDVQQIKMFATFGLVYMLNEEDSNKRNYTPSERVHVLKPVNVDGCHKFLSLRNKKLYSTTKLFVPVKEQLSANIEAY